MSTKYSLAIALVVGACALCAAQAARSAHQAPSCQKPEIVAGHWFAEPVGSQALRVKYQVAVNTYGQASRLQLLVNDGVAKEASLNSSFVLQTITLAVSALEEYLDTASVGVFLKTNCGQTSRRRRVMLPHGGYFGNQRLLPDPDYIVIDNRGSGEGAGFVSPPGAIFASKVRYLHPGSTLKIINDPFPAPGSKLDLVAAFAHLPGSKYGKSVAQGQAWLKERLAHLPTEHPGSLIFVVGYSQGADVAAEILGDGSWENVGGLLMFGDPHFTPGDSFNQGDYEDGYWGALGVRGDEITDDDTYVLSYCHAHDPVCQGIQWIPHYSFSTHTNYDQLGEPEDAARHFLVLWG